MITTPTVVLGFYPDRKTSVRVLRDVRRAGWRRSVLIHHPQEPGPTFGGHEIDVRGATIDVACVFIGVCALIGALLTTIFNHGSLLSAGLPLAAIGAVLIVVGVYRFRSSRIPREIKDHYRRWILPGETLLVVQVPLERAGPVLELLRPADGSEPATFVIRRTHRLDGSPPNMLPGERFSDELLKLKAIQLAARQRLMTYAKRGNPLGNRVVAAEQNIRTITGDLAEVGRLDQGTSVAAEWLLDNVYVITRHTADVRRNLSRGFYNVLPVLQSAPHAGEPRIYEIALELVAHGNGEFHERDIVDFVLAYQERTPLNISELWVLPLMLRVALIESLSRLATVVDVRQFDHERADLWANRILSAAHRGPDQILFASAELAREQPNPSAYVIDRIVSQLQGEAAALDTIRPWLEGKLDNSLTEVIQREQHRHAADQVAIANAIGSLRELSQIDWRLIFEQLSPVDRVLEGDPANAFGRMDFGTRDRYRGAIESLAGHAKISETEVAHKAIELAQSNENDPRRSHVGYFLIDRGRPELEARIECQWGFGARLRHLARRHATRTYLAAIVVNSLLVLGATLLIGAVLGQPRLQLLPLILLGALALVPGSDLGLFLTNFVVTHVLLPRPLPKLAFEEGIPPEWSTLVVVPTLFSSAQTIREDLENLEIRFLANQDANLHYGLLADFTDARAEVRLEDHALLEAARAGTEALNRRYPGDQFSLFYRSRTWSTSEQVWMGWERKRGKLEELNQWLIDLSTPPNTEATPLAATFHHVGNQPCLAGIRFVITLDADTQLPRNTARRLVGALAHPLNRPRLADDGQTVVEGYTIIQPRVSTSLPSVTATRFSRLLAGTAGTDPYTSATSDVFQDLFQEGSYHGKGIYDLHAFHQILGRRFPQETLLSHDLIEGAYVRVGLASDIELFDQFPSTYRAFAARQHRWIRGDWQIADWCTPRVPGPDGSSQSNPLSIINRWKIFDNLRRSLVQPACLALLVGSWLLLPEFRAVSDVLVALVLVLPAMIGLVDWLIARISKRAWMSFLGEGRRETGAALGTALLNLTLVPHQTVTSLDAIGRVLVRRTISHRRLLEWQTSRAIYRYAGDQARRFLWQLIAASTLPTMALATAIVVESPASLLAAFPYLIFWAAAPTVSSWLNYASRPVGTGQISTADRRFLRRQARLTWRYFDDLVRPETNWLPPDNYQVALRVEVASRTSPTNIGLGLLSTIAAHDFGYVTGEQAIERNSATFETLGKLERFRGHILNWYDVLTLTPLQPRYVSTADSGNLLASLWTLTRSYEEIAARPIISASALRGLEDTLDLVVSSLIGEPTGRRPREQVTALSDLTAKLADIFASPSNQVGDIVQRLRKASVHTQVLATLLQTRPGAAEVLPTKLDRRPSPVDRVTAPGTETEYWAGQLIHQVNDWLTVIQVYLPWLSSDSNLVQPFSRSISQPVGTTRSAGLAPSFRDLASESFGDKVDGDTDRSDAARSAARDLLQKLDRLIGLADDLASDLDLRFLYDPQRRLFSTGFNVEAGRLDPSHYDLLASEARLASFVAIARGDVPVDHWLTLGRPYGIVEGRPALLSWTGTMFEYLMPILLTRLYDRSLLAAACWQAVSGQIAYGKGLRLPWGVSESAFAAVDVHQIYQYQAFGVPSLGLKRDLEADLVVAPYASALALMVNPVAAIRNLKRLVRDGAAGADGFYDAIDFTPSRLAEGQKQIVVATYMAHHQGMTLLALDNALNRNVMQARFHANPMVRAAEPLLFERIPVAPPTVEGGDRNEAPVRPPTAGQPASVTRMESMDSTTPRTHLLGNANYAVMITNSGGGYSRWHDADVSRWRSDPTLDSWGSFIYVQDVDSQVVWSAAYQPVGREAPRYAVTFLSDRAIFERRDVGIETTTEIFVSPEDDAEIRQVTLVNRSGRRRRLQLTSYVELALADHNADRVHPAFSKIFVQTEAVPGQPALLAWRKPRLPSDPPIWSAHLLVVPPDAPQSWEFETDRARFVGRGRDLTNPAALDGPLSGSAGSPLDPIFSLRYQLTIEPGARTRIAFVTIAADSREHAEDLVRRYHDQRGIDRANELSGYQAQLEPRHLRVTADEIQNFQQLASYMLYPNARLRASEAQLRQNRLGQAHLWAHGISGDLPIMVVTISDRLDSDVVRQALLAHTFWRLRGFKSDLVILNEEASSYEQALQNYLKTLVQAHAQYTGMDQPGGIFLRPADHIPAEDLTLILTVARVVLVASRGLLIQQLSSPVESTPLPPALVGSPRTFDEPSAALPFLVLPYFNGVGGFTEDGREYAMYLGPGVETPTPWINVMATPSFGALVSESGQGFAWYGNSQSNRLLPWSNDPVADPSGDAIYLRDEETGVYWTPTATPIREIDAYRARHGQGYTVFEHNSHGIEQELTVFVPLNDAGGKPVRVQRLRLRNRTGRRRRLSATFYAEWVLGTTREESQLHVVTGWDAESQAILARNTYHADFPNRVAFASCSRPVSSYTGDRASFLGRNRSHARPDAMRRRSLSGRHGAGLDSCAAIQVLIDLEPGAEFDVTFLLGQANDVAEARQLIRDYRLPGRVSSDLSQTRGWWDHFLGTLQVQTPDLAVDFLLNRWLPYQTLSCRVWGRSAFYQSGGAFGFRDQLQDVLALLYAAPKLAREQILIAAARQFREGDVQHWWHPQSGAGVRTRISDDMLWLPYATAQYVRVTGDTTILDENVPFLEGHVLDASEHEAYFVPTPSLELASLLEHGRRAIARASGTGPHGLPLIGTGDWNDGLNLVGPEGKGESVWLAWFLIDVRNSFAELLDRTGQGEEAGTHRTHAQELAAVVETQGWDGAWYRRAYFDNGSPLGSSENSEARIDSIAQSWATISGAGITGHTDLAMRSLEENLVREKDGLILLLTPPFEHADPNPGYIQGYPTGVRENGGQYTHGAIWAALAFARRGEGDRAARVLRILNPIEHARTPADVETYKVEPYVIAADVYSLEGQVGRGGWTWYTGSAGWLYRVWIEDVLGFKLQDDRLTINPTISSDWPKFTITYRYRQTTYEILVENPDRVCHGVSRVSLDGQNQSDGSVTLVDDGGQHLIVVGLGK